MKRYYIANFSHGMSKSWILDEDENIYVLIEKHLENLNKGEKRKNWIYLIQLKEFEQDDFNRIWRH